MPSGVHFILCPECGALEPGAFIGARTGAVVPISSRHLRDERGFLYCRVCLVVWNRLHVAAMPADEHPHPPPPVSVRLGYEPGFDAREADDAHRFRMLAREESKVRGGSGGARQRARDRVNDAAAWCALLGLPDAVREAVLHHVSALALHADLRSLAGGSRTRPRAEAFTIATIAIVCERFRVACDVPLLFESVRFRKGPERITSEEYRIAYTASCAWYARNVWRHMTEPRR